jgi:hypothetical protein
MDKRRKDPLQLAEEASKAINTQAEETQRELNKMAVELSGEDITPNDWIRPNREVLENATKREAQGDPASSDNTLRIVFGTSGEYPDGTKWERDATPEETEEYENWSK